VPIARGDSVLSKIYKKQLFAREKQNNLYHPKVTNTIDNTSGQFSPAHQAFIILLGGSNVTLLTDGESALKNKKKLKKSLFSSHLRAWSWSRIEVPVNTPTNLHFCARKQGIKNYA